MKVLPGKCFDQMFCLSNLEVHNYSNRTVGGTDSIKNSQHEKMLRA